ncbi:acyl carrier protein [Paenibacillus chitinolyticus]|uniref:acyl carrier protein n=2 Tax=Paenibacillus chitinolyticus TaxID=79263 RepID=UPI0036DA6B19
MSNNQTSIEDIKIIKLIEDKVKAILKHDRDITLDEDLRKLGLDSMKSFEMVVQLEDEYDIEFSGDENLLERFSTIQKIKDSVDSKIKKY